MLRRARLARSVASETWNVVRRGIMGIPHRSTQLKFPFRFRHSNRYGNSGLSFFMPRLCNVVVTLQSPAVIFRSRLSLCSYKKIFHRSSAFCLLHFLLSPFPLSPSPFPPFSPTEDSNGGQFSRYSFACSCTLQFSATICQSIFWEQPHRATR